MCTSPDQGPAFTRPIPGARPSASFAVPICSWQIGGHHIEKGSPGGGPFLYASPVEGSAWARCFPALRSFGPASLP